jgi:folate-binding Fe-S cluster repair protein YgfZ
VSTQVQAATGARVARLARRGVVAVAGRDALRFLNDLVTADVAHAAAARAVYAGLLAPQGKVLFDFFVFRDPDGGFLIDVARGKAADLVKRLGFYRLRADVALADRSGDLAVLPSRRTAWQPTPARPNTTPTGSRSASRRVASTSPTARCSPTTSTWTSSAESISPRGATSARRSYRGWSTATAPGGGW